LVSAIMDFGPFISGWAWVIRLDGFGLVILQLAGYKSNNMCDQNLNKVKNILQKISKRLKID